MNPIVRDHYVGKPVVLNADHLPLMNDAVHLREYLPVCFPTGCYNKYIPVIAEG